MLCFSHTIFVGLKWEKKNIIMYAGKRENPLNGDECVLLMESLQTVQLVHQIMTYVIDSYS